jgi:hypothetical protein
MICRLLYQSVVALLPVALSLYIKRYRFVICFIGRPVTFTGRQAVLSAAMSIAESVSVACSVGLFVAFFTKEVTFTKEEAALSAAMTHAQSLSSSLAKRSHIFSQEMRLL